MKVRHLCYDVESADHMNRFSNVDGITADHAVNSISLPDVLRGSDAPVALARQQSVGGWDEQQFSARSIECYTCLSRFREM